MNIEEKELLCSPSVNFPGWKYTNFFILVAMNCLHMYLIFAQYSELIAYLSV